MGRNKRSMKREVFRKMFGATSVTKRNIKRGITAIKKSGYQKRTLVRRMVVEDAQKAMKAGNMAKFNLNKRVLAETTATKIQSGNRRRRRFR